MWLHRLHWLEQFALLLVLVVALGALGVWGLSEMVHAGLSRIDASEPDGVSAPVLPVSTGGPTRLSLREKKLMEIQRFHVRAGHEAGAENPRPEVPREALESILQEQE